ncbi:CatB-related O-acetyltransferase [Ignatzschineria larvae DSM 13226]|uniref:CatB-related O-acetyltransferase n=1 Tax=Ignatzschineria larvae DSM 13226 TaxID=1111732 RepID=A0ABZ3BXA1_9GAMM|nr:CatB-related O-acetyltransferase [Ignatzschineria larvae]
MSIICEEGSNVTISVTNDLIDFFEENRIYCHEQKNNAPRRWKVGDRLFTLKNIELEPYICYRSGHHLFSLGAFSYSSSVFPLNVQIGRYCSIAYNVRVMGWQHPVSAVTTNVLTCVPSIRWVKIAHEDFGVDNFAYVPTPQKGSINIGHDVWIGQDVLLSQGINIGTGAIIAAGAVVTKDVEPYSIVGGNKAQLIRYRFPEEIRLQLLASKWWEYSFKDLQRLDFSNPIAFIQKFERIQKDLEVWDPSLINVYRYLKNNS